LHGYALQIELTFGADTLTKEGWVIDFGSLKPIKDWLQHMFDHKMIIAEDDPAKEVFLELGAAGLAEIHVLPQVGCEAFTLYIFDHVTLWLAQATRHRVRLTEVTVREHEANAVTCVPL
jgi:6-pyruvoyltetrahydropterin/6-carboxytetrahydropterin synthase